MDLGVSTPDWTWRRHINQPLSYLHFHGIYFLVLDYIFLEAEPFSTAVGHLGTAARPINNALLQCLGSSNTNLFFWFLIFIFIFMCPPQNDLWTHPAHPTGVKVGVHLQAATCPFVNANICTFRTSAQKQALGSFNSFNAKLFSA